MVIVVLAYCLPQHPAPGVLAMVSLALLGIYRADQQTTPESPQEAGSSTSLCNVPSATPPATPHPLQRFIERCSPPASNGCNIGTRLPWDLPLGKRENALYYHCNCIFSYKVIRLLLYANLWCCHFLWWFKVVICTDLGLYINLYTFYCWLTLLLKGIPYRYFASQSGKVVNRLERLFMVCGFSIVCDLE